MTRFLIFLLGLAAAAQVYPSRPINNQDLSPTMDFGVSTLSSTINASVTTLTVASAARMAAPVVLNIDGELLKCGSLAGNVYTNCTRGFGATTPSGHTAGATVRSVISAAGHWEPIRKEIIAIESAITAVAAFAPQTPGGSLAVGANTVTLTPVPDGVNGSDQNHYLWVANGVGTAEACLITGGTAVSGAPTGTVILTCANTHTGAWTVESATAGIRENQIRAGNAGCVRLPAGTYTLRVSVPLSMSGACLAGSGIDQTILSYSGAGNAVTVQGSGAISNVRVQDLSIQGPGAAGTGIYVQGAWFAVFADLKVTGFATGMDARSMLVSRIVRGLWWANATNIKLTDSNANEILGASIQTASAQCVQIAGTGSGNIIRGGDIQSCGGTAAALVNTSSNMIEGVWFEANSGLNIQVITAGVPTDSNRIENNTFADLKGLTIGSGQNNYVAGNFIPGGPITVTGSAANTYIGQQAYFDAAQYSNAGINTMYWHNRSPDDTVVTPMDYDSFRARWAWSRTVSDPGLGLVTATVGCPQGIDPGTPIRVTGGAGQPDYTARILDGTCIGASGGTGTLIWKSPGAKTGSVTISSGTDGIQEAINQVPITSPVDVYVPPGRYHLWSTLHFGGRPGTLRGAGAWGTRLLGHATTETWVEMGDRWPRTQLSRVMDAVQTEVFTYSTRGFAAPTTIEIDDEAIYCANFQVVASEGRFYNCTRGYVDNGGITTTAGVHALDAAVINVANVGVIGEYAIEGFSITDPSETAYVGNSTSRNGLLLRNGYRTAKVRNMEIRNANVGLQIRDSWNAIVENSTIRFAYNYGIWSEGSIDVQLNNNFVSNNGLTPWVNQWRYSAGLYVTSGNPIVKGNSFLSFGYGMAVSPTNPAYALYGQVSDNLFDGNLNANVRLLNTGYITGWKFTNNWNSYCLFGPGWVLDNAKIQNVQISGGHTRENAGDSFWVYAWDKDLGITNTRITAAGRAMPATLSTDIDAAAITVVVSEWQMYPTGVSGNAILTIGTEQIRCTTYAAVSGVSGTFTGCTRGINATTAAPHSAGAAVSARYELRSGVTVSALSGGIQINGNRIGNSDSLSSNEDYGIQIAAGAASKFQISGNDLNANNTAPLLNGATLTDSYVGGNIPNSVPSNPNNIPACTFAQLAGGQRSLCLCTDCSVSAGACIAAGAGALAYNYAGSWKCVQ